MVIKMEIYFKGFAVFVGIMMVGVIATGVILVALDITSEDRLDAEKYSNPYYQIKAYLIITTYMEIVTLVAYLSLR